MPHEIRIPLPLIGAPPRTSAGPLHAALFKWLETSDGGGPFARQLDEQEGLKPFTVSGILFDDVERRSTLMRITLLEEGRDLLDRLLQGLERRPFVQLYDQRLDIRLKDCLMKSESFREIQSHAMSNRMVCLRFESPTAFQTHGLHYPLPDPVFVFASYLDRWNRFAPRELTFAPEWVDWLRESVGISRFRLQEGIMQYAKYHHVGCLGDVEYCVLTKKAGDTTQTGITTLNALANFARYCGTGHRATQGMGQTKRIGA